MTDQAQPQPTPLQGWITGWTEFLRSSLPAIFLVVVLVVGCVMIFMRRGYWPRKTILFGIGAVEIRGWRHRRHQPDPDWWVAVVAVDALPVELRELVP